MKRVLAIACVCFVFSTSALGLAEGSWAQINQPINRPENWLSFVTDSPFELGIKEEMGEVNGLTAYRQSYGSYPSLDGSTVAVPMAMELARQLLGLREEDLSGFVTFSTTHNAYTRLIERRPNLSAKINSGMIAMDENHPVDLILATGPSKEELQMASDAGVTLVTTPICYDAFVFLVNARNPVNGLTIDQIRQIYTGQIQNWANIGGSSREILPFQREPNSGSQTAMETLVMQGIPMAGVIPNFVSDGMADLVRQVGDYNNGEASIGYSYLYYLENLFASDEVKTLAIDGYSPTRENIRSGLYPFGTCYYAVYRQGDALGQAFTEWLLSEPGQRCIEQAGYIPIAE